jgi:hypothetical protein
MSIMNGYLTRQQLAQELSPRDGRPLDPRTIARLEREACPTSPSRGASCTPLNALNSGCANVKGATQQHEQPIAEKRNALSREPLAGPSFAKREVF